MKEGRKEGRQEGRKKVKEGRQEGGYRKDGRKIKEERKERRKEGRKEGKEDGRHLGKGRRGPGGCYHKNGIGHHHNTPHHVHALEVGKGGRKNDGKEGRAEEK